MITRLKIIERALNTIKKPREIENLYKNIIIDGETNFIKLKNLREKLKNLE